MQTVTYRATFSNGQTVTRTSERDYHFCGAFIHRETGEMTGESFGLKHPQPYWARVSETMPDRRARYSYQQRLAIAERIKHQRSKWTFEIVPVEKVTK